MVRQGAYKNAHRGGALSEYGFIGVLIVVGAIGVCLLLGNNLNLALQAMRGDLGRNVDASANAATITAQGGIPGGSGIGGQISAPSADQQQVCYQSGWCVNIPQNSVANGATTGTMGDRMSSYADIVRQIDRQVSVSDRVRDPVLRQLISALARQGNYIGAAQRNVAQKCPRNSICVVDGIDVNNIANNVTAFNMLEQQLRDYLRNHPTNDLPPEIVAMLLDNTGNIQEIASQYTEGAVLTAGTAISNVVGTTTSAANICTQGISGLCDASQSNVDSTGSSSGTTGTRGTATQIPDDEDLITSPATSGPVAAEPGTSSPAPVTSQPAPPAASEPDPVTEPLVIPPSPDPVFGSGV